MRVVWRYEVPPRSLIAGTGAGVNAPTVSACASGSALGGAFSGMGVVGGVGGTARGWVWTSASVPTSVSVSVSVLGLLVVETRQQQGLPQPQALSPKPLDTALILGVMNYYPICDLASFHFDRRSTAPFIEIARIKKDYV